MFADRRGQVRVSGRSTMIRLLLCAVLVAGLLGVVASRAHADNTTVSNDQARTGWYPSEPGLSPSQVTSGDFGRQWATTLDGSVYAQPLVVGGTVVVATEKATAYGVSASTGAILWTRHFGAPFQSASIGCGDLTPDLGSTSTPVYDGASGTVYLTTKLADGPTARQPHWYVQAISLATGAERPGYPLLLQGTADNDPTVTFDPFVQHQRAGLLLAGGVLYIGFGSHCDLGDWRGWVLAVAAGTSPHIQSAWTTEVANGSGAGVWQAGGGLVTDGNDGTGKPRVFLATGNGISPPPGLGTAPTGLLGDAVVRLGLNASGHLAAQDFFAPANAPVLDQNDLDLGSGGPVALPDSFGTASHPHLLVEDGKDGRVFLLDRDRLGGRGQGSGGGDAAIQVIGPSHGIWGHPAAYGGEGGWVYYVENRGPLRAYRRTTTSSGDPALAAVGNSAASFGYTSGSPIVTSTGTTPGSALVWVVSSTGSAGLDARLQAYDAVPTAGSLRLRWSAPIGVASKFAVPAAAGGRVFVGTRDGKLLAFGRPATTPLVGRPVDFGDVATGTTARGSATFTANASVTLTAAATSSPFGVDTSALGLPRAVRAGETLSMPVTFAPGSPGAATATLTLTTSAGPAAADLHGVGTQPGLGAGPAALDFGTVPTHSSSTLTVSVTNTGTTAETVSAVTPPGSPFSAANLPAAGLSVAPGASLAVAVTYTPTAAGPSSDSFTITSTSGRLIVPLTGIGQVGHGVLSLTPTTTDFGDVVVGTSRTLGFDISNTGNIPLTITLAKAPSGAFSAVNPLSEGVTLTPGDVVHQQVTFTPTTTGRVSAAYTVNGDTGQPAQAEMLVGTGVTGTTLAAPTSAAWTRNGSATVSASDLVLTPAAAYQTGSAFSTVALPSEGLAARFTASIGGGSGADGMTFTLLDASQPATSLGLGGGGLGYGGLPQSIAVTLDTYQNGLDPSGNFLGVADGVLAGGKGGLRYVATSTNVGPLKAGTHDVGVDVHGGRLQVTVDGDLKIDTQVTLPAYVRPGFTAGTGKATDRHLVRDVMITSPQLRPDTVPPAVTLTRPTPGTLTGTTTVAASAVDDASGTARVAFTLDGRQLGAAATTAPYQVAWDTTRVPNGKHTLAATAMDAAGNVATSKAVTVTVNNPLPVDGSVSTDGRGTLTAPPLTTTKSGDLLLALVSAHGPGTGGQSMTVSGGGLTWSLVKRAAGVRGTAELWQARASRVLSRVAVTARPAKGGYDGSLTVLALSGTKAATTATARSATTGAPSVALRTGYPGSWVVGVGSDPGSAAGRRPVAGQTLVHQWADRTAAATFWVQLSSPAVPAGTTTRLADTWPTTDGWNLVAVELPRA